VDDVGNWAWHNVGEILRLLVPNAARKLQTVRVVHCVILDDSRARVRRKAADESANEPANRATNRHANRTGAACARPLTPGPKALELLRRRDSVNKFCNALGVPPQVYINDACLIVSEFRSDILRDMR
jgi:hypothetical protein